MIDWKNFNWKEALPFTTILLVGLYVSAYFVKIGEMIFYGYPFSLFKFNASDLLLYSLKPLFLIAFISFIGFFVKTAYYSKFLRKIYIILSGVTFIIGLLDNYLPALSQLNLRPFGSVILAFYITYLLNSLILYIEKKSDFVKLAFVTFFISISYIYIYFLNQVRYLVFLICFIPIGSALVVCAIFTFDSFIKTALPRYFIFLIISIATFLIYTGSTYNLLSNSFLTTEDGKFVVGIYDDNIILKGCHAETDSFEIINPAEKGTIFLNKTLQLTDYLSSNKCK